MPMRNVVRKTLLGAGIAIFSAVIGGIAGILSNAYLEVWFEDVEGIVATDVATWPKIVRGVSASLDLTRPKAYRTYYGENIGNLETKISTADLSLRFFKVTGKMVGTKTKGDKTYGIVGYDNGTHLVLTQHGNEAGGVGTYFVKFTQLEGAVAHFGYFLTEDIKEAGGPIWVTQCPFVMLNRKSAEASYPNAEAAKNAFGFLKTKCVEYKLPTSILVEVASRHDSP